MIMQMVTAVSQQCSFSQIRENGLILPVNWEELDLKYINWVCFEYNLTADIILSLVS
jgi:hypothetical protein